MEIGLCNFACIAMLGFYWFWTLGSSALAWFLHLKRCKMNVITVRDKVPYYCLVSSNSHNIHNTAPKYSNWCCCLDPLLLALLASSLAYLSSWPAMRARSLADVHKVHSCPSCIRSVITTHMKNSCPKLDYYSFTSTNNHSSAFSCSMQA